ncbi:amidohydrolase family protein [Pseudonocardia sulfidoxydans]|uniref:amidohydrolase family protein n=1 Tax=Pseudonocardia sulfidoxydans TaxID=54011 RepID=UPI0011BEBA30|nr:amidohydrolase family protein [Pseudonocardia sulfidoxydans]
MEPTTQPVLDAHAHAVPEPLLTALAARGGIDGVTAHDTGDGWSVELPGAGPKPVRPPMYSADRRAAYRCATGIDGQLLAPWLDLQPTAAMPPDAARSWAGRVNDALLAECAASRGPGVLATVALDDVEAAAKDLEAAVRDGCAGLVLSTDPVHCTSLADPRLDPLWTVAAGLGVPVQLHPASTGPARALPDSAEFGNAYCRLVDTTFGVARLILAGVLDRFPGLRLITVHGGGFLPYQAARLDGAHRADALSAHTIGRDRPSDYLRDLYYDTVALTPEAIRFLTDAVGHDRVLLGSDSPFPLGDPQPATTVRAAGLGPDATDAVLGGNLGGLLTGSPS